VGVYFFSHLWTFLYSYTNEPDSKLLSLPNKARLYHPPNPLYMSFPKASSGLFFGDVAWFSNGLVFGGDHGYFFVFKVDFVLFYSNYQEIVFFRKQAPLGGRGSLVVFIRFSFNSPVVWADGKKLGDSGDRFKDFYGAGVFYFFIISSFFPSC
jgi:hypothetical protein